MTGAEARVVDPILSTVARGYKNEELIWPHLFPVVPVMARAGKVIVFNADDFTKYTTERAPGANRERAEFGYGSQNYACVQRALDGVIPKETVEEAAAVPGINMQQATVQKTMAVIDLQVEVAAANLATTSGNYSATHHTALAGNARWDHADSTPNKAVETARQKIRRAIGKKPNVLVLGDAVFGALCNHKDVIDRVRYTERLGDGGEPTINEMKLASYFEVDKVIVGAAMTGEPGEFVDAWGKNAILAFSDVTPLASMGSPSFGYTYRLNGYPVARPGWFNQDNDSWIFAVTTEDTPVIAGKDGGYLFSSVVS